MESEQWARVYIVTPVEMVTVETRKYLGKMTTVRELSWVVMRYVMAVCVIFTSIWATAQVDAPGCQLAVSSRHSLKS